MSSSTVSKTNTQGFLRAVRDNNTAEVQKYIKAGIDINAFYDEDTPLYIAIQNNSIPMVKLLLENNAVLNKLVDIDSILFHAVSQGNVQIVELLLRAGADPEFENYDKKTPLFKAVENQSVKIIQLLCEYNANPKHATHDKQTPFNIAKTDRVRKALEICIPKRKEYQPTAKGIQRIIFNFIDTKGTFPIQSQKTGQCFSDSLQHVLYFADGIRDFFIERAVEVYPRIQSEGELPLTRDAYIASLMNKIKADYGRFKESAKSKGYTFEVSLDEYIKRRLPTEATNMYLDFTGVRFLDMFLRPIIQAPLSKTSVMARRPSVVSLFFNQPTGIVCSQILNIYQVTQSIFKSRSHTYHKNENTLNSSRISELKNLPETLNVEGFGLLSDSTEYEFWDELLRNIPPEVGKALIKGGTDIQEYKMAFETRKGTRYAVDPNTIVGILFAVFPRGKVMRNVGAGHALSMVKMRGKWYICDDNIGIAIPCAPFKMNKLLEGQFGIRYSGFKIEYYFRDDFKMAMLFEEAERNHPGERNLKKYVPETSYITFLAEVPLKVEAKLEVLEESLEGGEGGFMDLSISRKYICWQPASSAAAPATAPLNASLQALATKYKV